MPSQRRMRAFGLFLFLAIAITLYMTNSARQTRNSAFYVKTQEALQAREYMEATKQRDAESVESRLKEAEDTAKKAANEKHDRYLESVGGGTPEQKGKSVGGGKFKIQDGEQKGVPGVATVGGRPRDKLSSKEKEAESPEDHEVEVELNAILKKSPIIIFSKSYCPHSQKAKHILLEKYTIVPTPYVVELDEHPLGLKLQEMLAEKTGRRTVPNVLVLGMSIGGGSEMQDFDEKDQLATKIKGVGGSRITEVERRMAAQSEMRRRRVMRA
ncbi:thioredoxin-like protein [Byssothecium circinans]|uniref:Thioredoxin-like protein n=1 Tax=Byssothecium circinans TaxID=147558 RepID=A0A6A5TJ42_9PLEO|nr:thioredoxin-like protein [Byssothecium circinans]